jgi:hypothetical protein
MSITADKVEWIENLTDILVLQLNRIKFENNKATKTNHCVEILPEFYPDRFLKQNSSLVEEILQKITYLKAQLAHL